MNIGAWPIETEELTNAQVQHQEIASKENAKIFWTKVFLQTNAYDEKRYRQIASNACERIMQEDSKPTTSRSTAHHSPSLIALSLSEMSTQKSSSNNRSPSKTITLPIHSRKPSSYTRFSCYLKPTNAINRSKKIKKNPLPSTGTLFKNNNNCHDKMKHLSRLTSRKGVIRQNRYEICRKCSKSVPTNAAHSSLNMYYCPSCLSLIQNSNNKFLRKKFSLNKNDENELRRLIEIIIEEFQDHFGLALNLSIKQMTQHLLSNVNLFYSHYQQEFEQLTKKYRHEFLERFLRLMKKHQNGSNITNAIQNSKLSIPDRNCITHPPDILSMSSLTGSLTTERDQSEPSGQLMTQSDSIALSTASNRSLAINENNLDNDRKNLSIQNTSSKNTFTLNKTEEKQSFNKSKKSTSSSIQLLDAYRFRDTLHVNKTYLSSPRPKIR